MTYDPRGFNPGDVAMVKRGRWSGRAMYTLKGWVDQDGDFDRKSPLLDVADARPLVVLDPESDDDGGRVFNAFKRLEPSEVRAALRSLVAKPKCSAHVNIAGADYRCVEAAEHGGPHRSPDAEAVWS